MNKCKKWTIEEGECKRKGKAVYCEKHQAEILEERNEHKLKLSNRNHLLWFILLFPLTIFLLSVSYLYITAVDENLLCQTKIEKYFPEYSFDEIWYYGSNQCRGSYSVEKYEIRDGLKRTVGDAQTKTIKFKLLNKEDQKYVAKDDWIVFTFLFGLLGIFVLIGVAVSWKDNGKWWK